MFGSLRRAERGEGPPRVGASRGRPGKRLQGDIPGHERPVVLARRRRVHAAIGDELLRIPPIVNPR
jgi:hypothetical protein